MQRINQMDMNNTPFNIDRKYGRAVDGAENIPMPFTNITSKNSEAFLRDLNLQSELIKKKLGKLRDRLIEIPVDEEIKTVIIDFDTLSGIIKLVDNLHISFEKLFDSAK